MLQRLLEEIQQGGVLDINHLADRLDVSPQMIQAMVEHLEIAGYLKPFSTCTSACDGCALKSACGPGNRHTHLRIWQSESR